VEAQSVGISRKENNRQKSDKTMQDIFLLIDSWHSKFNLLRDYKYLRKVALIFALTMIPLWLALGFDSGVGMIEEGFKTLLFGGNISEAAYSVYGRSFHFSSYVIYGILFYALSRLFERLNLKGSKNVCYSTFLVLFNIGVFEIWYMASFAHYQMKRNLTEWFITDFFATPVIMNILFLVLGSLTILAVWLDSFTLNSGKIVGRNFRFSPDKKLIIPLLLCLASISLWIYFPLPVEQATLADWTSSTLFPQTHYAYKNSKLYVANDALHHS